MQEFSIFSNLERNKIKSTMWKVYTKRIPSMLPSNMYRKAFLPTQKGFTEEKRNSMKSRKKLVQYLSVFTSRNPLKCRRLWNRKLLRHISFLRAPNRAVQSSESTFSKAFNPQKLPLITFYHILKSPCRRHDFLFVL